MPRKLNAGIAVIGIDIGKNSFHVVGHDKRGAIMLRQKWSRGQTKPPYGTLMPQSGRRPQHHSPRMDTPRDGGMSTSPRKRTNGQTSSQVRLVPLADLSNRSKAAFPFDRFAEP